MAIKNLSLQTIGLHVGYKDYSKITVGQMRLSPYKKTGVFTCSGISIFGKVTDGARGVVTIGKVDSLSKFPFSDSLYVLGTSKFFDDMTVASNVKVTKNLTVSGTTYASVQGTINVQGWKGFDIKHPTKENHRLRYVCLEASRGGVYQRYFKRQWIHWTSWLLEDLVDTKTITVHLTPIGTYQYLYYTVAKNRIIVKNHSNLQLTVVT